MRVWGNSREEEHHANVSSTRGSGFCALEGRPLCLRVCLDFVFVENRQYSVSHAGDPFIPHKQTWTDVGSVKFIGIAEAKKTVIQRVPIQQVAVDGNAAAKALTGAAQRSWIDSNPEVFWRRAVATGCVDIFIFIFDLSRENRSLFGVDVGCAHPTAPRLSSLSRFNVRGLFVRALAGFA